jgi:cytochrome c oxidase assembly protein subunit 11
MTKRPQNSLEARHRRVAISCAAVAVGMIGMSYAAVPLYRMFCQATGFAGTTQRAEKPSDKVLDQTVSIRFDANVAPGFPWEFAPEAGTIDVKVGENSLAFFKAENRSDHATTGQATFNVTPEIAGVYFVKVACFCFQEQRLEPGQSVEMPVSFYVDPAIAADKDARRVSQITLSYTFFPAAEKAAVVKPADAASGGGKS